MARKSKGIPLKKNILIFCEGDTEVLYFEMLNQKYKSSTTVRIRPVCRNGKQGEDLIKDLIQQMKTNPVYSPRKYESVYAVFDKDDLPLVDIKRAYELAEKHDITVIFSNECFDLWLLKHYKKVTGHSDRSSIYKSLRKELNLPKEYTKYKADKAFIERHFRHAVSQAMQNTQHIDDINANMAIPSNPYTNIHINLEKIYKRTNTSSGW